MLLAEKPLASLRIPACLATQSFAIARSKALWKNIPLEDINRRFDSANRLCRSDSAFQRGESRTGKVRLALQAIWTCLAGVSPEHIATLGSQLGPIAAALRALQKARSNRDPEEARKFAMP